MTDAEALEKARQAIMRFRELLDIMQQQINEGEQAYARLFAALDPAETDGRAVKEIQRLAAHAVAASPEALRRAALHQGFGCRNLERDFTQVHDALVFDADE
ncbi:MAG: hypothetical protein BroJett033_1550 [Chloroflexota bacterium]|nr:MAG: hypothetical protein BroJett033_1550 [Chloroflexota bacterium]